MCARTLRSRQWKMRLGRYTHRVAFSDYRLPAVEDGTVRFRWKDYRQSHRHKTMRLPDEEFMRRILTQVLPRDFHRIRHFGLLANIWLAPELSTAPDTKNGGLRQYCDRKARLALCRRLLGMPPHQPATDPPPD